MGPRELFVSYALTFLGTFYAWGGDDPSGFDCSGLVVECLQAAGLMDAGDDDTAEGLRRRYASRRTDRLRSGCLVFWVNARGRATHVEIAFDAEHTIGASGGTSRTRTHADAIRDNAYVKMRPWWYRTRNRKSLVIVDPFGEWDHG